MTAILNLAFALLAGLLMTRIFSRWHLPDVTAFLVTGVLIGPFVLGRLGVPGLGFAGYDQVEALSMISDVAMGFIAFSIGNEFRLSQLKKTGKQAMVIGVLQALAALAFVDIALVAFHFLRPDVLSVPAAITLGAIATATALDDLGISSGRSTGGTTRFFVSDTPDGFAKQERLFMGSEAGGPVEQIAIETY